MKRGTSLVVSVPARLIGLIIVVYQKLVSPNLSANCRFQPSCSQYMLEAVRRFGAVKGVWIGIRRISRCHPMHAGGFDPVPESWPAPHEWPVKEMDGR